MKKISFPRKYEMSWWISTEYVNVDFVIGEHLCDAPRFFQHLHLVQQHC